MRFTACILLMLTALSACTTADYASGVGSFSQAVTKLGAAEQALAAADQQARLRQWRDLAGSEPPTHVFVDLGKCRPATAAAYRPGDCAVQSQAHGPAPVAQRPSSMQALTVYAGLLSDITAEKTCASLQTDGQDLAKSIAGMAGQLKDTRLADAAGPFATLASTATCWVIDRRKIDLLKTATLAADPVVAQLTILIADRDQQMADTIVDEQARELGKAGRAYQAGGGEFTNLVSLASMVDQAQAASPRQAVESIAILHHELERDLQAPTVSLRRVQRDAETLLNNAQTIEAAVEKLSASSRAAKPSTSP